MKLPLPPTPAGLERSDEDMTVLAARPLWRIHRTAGDRPTGWNAMRWWGPGRSMRFDPHVPPPRVQDRAVCYTALEVPTVLAEVFQTTRTINRSRGSPWLTAWTPIRDLALLNLTGDWPIRNGASYSINTGRKDHCRRWAEAIHTAWPELDGLLSHSSMTGRPMVTLFTHAHGTFPERPSFSRALADLGLREDLAVAARQIRYDLV